MQTCEACASENPDGHRFCGGCGAALAQPLLDRRRLVTSVFCDLSGSTGMGERADAEAVFELMRSYFDAARAALERHGGAVEKFIGDAVVGMFGVPETHEDDALRACRAALEIQDRIASLNSELKARLDTEIAVRIGVNTGEVVAGDAARREMFATGDAVVLGDAVNIAARLEQAAAPGEILLGDATYRLVKGAVVAEPVAPIQAKGKSEPLIVYRLLEVSAHGPIPRMASAALVGRLEELDRLESELDQVRSENRSRLITIVGEAGVGKSRLAAELLEGAGERARIAQGACLSYGEGITYWPIAQVVRGLAGIRDDHTLDEARSRLPLRIQQLLGLSEGTMTADQAGDAVAELLAAAEPDRLLVVVVDDIHWAEPGLLELLVRLPRLLDGKPVAILCLARPELLEQRPDWDVTVRLEPLGSAQVDLLLENLEAPAGARVRIAQAAAGNPLFAEELVAWAHEGGNMNALPTSLNALLSARLDRLERSERDALERGAVEGELFHQAAVVELTDQPSRTAVPLGLGELNRKDMIRLVATSLAGEIFAYRFKHILVRDAAYRATTKKLRASLHERYADWLEQRAGGRVGEYHEILGYHLEQAYEYRSELGDRDEPLAARAGRHLGAAGRRANDRADVNAAASLLGRATKLFPADSPERLELMRHLVYAVDQTGRMREARTISQELYERATALGDRRLAAHGKSYATPHPFFDVESDPAAATAAFEEVIATFEELGDGAGLAAAKRRLALVHRIRGRFAASAALLEEALVSADACDDMSTRRAVVYSLANDISFGPMPVALAIPRAERLRTESRDDHVLEAAVDRHLSLLYAMAGRFEEARSLELHAGPVLEEADLESLSWGSLGASSRTKILLGDVAGAERDLRAKWRAYPVEAGTSQSLAIAAAQALACLYCREGRWEEAEGCLAAVRREGSENGDGRIAAAGLASHYGNHEEAVTLARRAVEMRQRTDALSGRAEAWLALARAERAAGHIEGADSAIAMALSLLDQKGNIAAAAQVRDSLGLLV